MLDEVEDVEVIELERELFGDLKEQAVSGEERAKV